ncbi:MAG: AAA family ATPase [Terriglobia bacterium]
MSDTIERLTIEGFKSIRKLENFELRPLNVLIGANGAGKSNFVAFFRFLREIIDQRLQQTVATEGGADAQLYLGPKVTLRVRGRFAFGANSYEFELAPTNDNRLIFAREIVSFTGQFHSWQPLGSGHLEAKLKERKDDPGKTGWHGVPWHVYEAVSGWVVYHFHDTSPESGVRRQRAINDNEYLRPDAGNLAAFLYRIQQTNPTHYEKIRGVVRLAAPFFDDFKLRPVADKPELIQLEWLQKGSDYPFRPSQLSDGTLRFICLATALLQPLPPATMLFDEPELGAHPYALTLLANLFRQATKDTFRQVIVSTQSAQLVNEFEPEDVIVVERTQGESVFRRLESAKLSGWLEDYTLGELWQKNVLGGGPRNEAMPLPPESDGNPPPLPEPEAKSTGDGRP